MVFLFVGRVIDPPSQQTRTRAGSRLSRDRFRPQLGVLGFAFFNHGFQQHLGYVELRYFFAVFVG